MSSPAPTLSLARLPYLGTAEADVRFVEWLVRPGDALRRGQTIAVIETLKATFEVEAEVEGVLLCALVAAGERVDARAGIAVVGPEGAAVADAEVAALLAAGERGDGPAGVAGEPIGAPGEGVGTTSAGGTSRGTSTENAGDAGSGACAGDAGNGGAGHAGCRPVAPSARDVAEREGRAGVRAAPAARRRAAELGLDLAAVPGGGRGGLVRVVDVESSAAAGPGIRAAGGVLDPGFLAELRRDRAAFARLGSALKLAIYRRMGAVIGADAVLAPGAVIVAERLVLGRGACVGADAVVDVVDLEAGELWHLGARSCVRCRRARFGANAFLADDVEIGGGGALDPEAELVVGSHGFVGEHAHLNPCRRIELGDEVVVSRNVSIMTHSFGGSALRGYPNRFAGVTVGDGAQLGIGAVLFPGVEVGAGAILLSGSSLVSSVPPGRLFGGVPAVDLKAAAVTLAPAEVAERARELLLELARQLELRGFDVARETSERELRIAVRRGGDVHLLRFAPDAPPHGAAGATAEEIRVGTAWDPAAWAALADEPDVCAVDLSIPATRGAPGPLADALREFLRKRGVRLRPRAWTYRGGWL